MKWNENNKKNFRYYNMIVAIVKDLVYNIVIYLQS